MAFRDRYKKAEEKKDKTVEEVTELIKDAEESAKKDEKKAPIKRASSDEIITNLEKKIRKRDLKKPRPYINISIMGDTIEVREFRAICKKNSLQMNTTLKTILHEWNKANYNL